MWFFELFAMFFIMRKNTRSPIRDPVFCCANLSGFSLKGPVGRCDCFVFFLKTEFADDIIEFVHYPKKGEEVEVTVI